MSDEANAMIRAEAEAAAEETAAKLLNIVAEAGAAVGQEILAARIEGAEAMKAAGIREAEESEGAFCCSTFTRLLLEDLDPRAVVEKIR